jgi:ABC-type amino acid transport substrate-binding protein
MFAQTSRLFAFKILLLVLGFFVATPSARAEQPVLTVAVYDLPPYGGVAANGAFEGASVDLWRRVAEQEGLAYRLIAVAKMDAILAGLRDGRYDVAVGAITITPERSTQVDFTYPAHRSGVAVATRRQGGPLHALMSLGQVAIDLSSLLILVALTMLVMGLVMWFVERRSRHPALPSDASSVASLRDGIYWAVVTMTTVGYGDKTPKTSFGRLLAILWMLGSLALISVLSASLVSRMTLDQIGETDSYVSGDLAGHRLAAVAFSSGAEFLDARHLPYAKHDDLAGALESLRVGDADMVINSVGALRHMTAKKFRSSLHVQREMLSPAYMAFALPQNSALKRRLDRALMRVTAGEEWRAVEESYFLP